MFSVSHQADAQVCTKHVEVLQTELSSHVKLLKETMEMKKAVLTAKVFVIVFVIPLERLL